MTLERRLMAEWLGTFSLLATVIGSGIMAERLADGNVAIALLGNTIPTGAILVVLITIFGPISGAHFNPAVTLSFALRREIEKRDAVLYVVAQIFGGIVGVLAAHLMFEHPLLDPSTTSRSGIGNGRVSLLQPLVWSARSTRASKHGRLQCPWLLGSISQPLIGSRLLRRSQTLQLRLHAVSRTLLRGSPLLMSQLLLACR